MKCSNCNEITIRHEPKQDTICDPECISPGHDNDEVWLICSTCNFYHLECPNCLNCCKLIGFSGEIKSDDSEIDGSIHFFDGKIFEGDFYEIFVGGYVPIPEELQTYYLDRSKWYPTGMDGSKFSKWKCLECNYSIKSFE